jgi:hypothetical protein
MMPRADLLVRGAAAAFLLGLAMAPAAAKDVPIADTHVFPESLSADAAGRLYIGSVKGIVYRSGPGAAGPAVPWIKRDASNKLLSILGVLVDERAKTLWLCSSPMPFTTPPTLGTSAVMAFDLGTGAHKATYPFPGERSACNDIAVAKDGTLYATDTANGRIMAIRPGAKELAPFAQEPALRGVDGIAFAEDGTLYVNNVQTQKMHRVERKPDGSFDKLVELALSQPIAGPDALRPIAGNRFVQAEGNAGRVTEVTIAGDTAAIRTLRDGLNSTAAANYAHGKVYAIEGRILYLVDPKLKGQDPGPFVALEIPLEGAR